MTMSDIQIDLSDFVDYVRDNIRSYLPDAYQNATVEIHNVIKTNDVKLHGLTVRRQDQQGAPAPTIYLEYYYETLKDGNNPDKILADIAKRIVENADRCEIDVDVDDIVSFDAVRDRLSARLINLDTNAGYLTDKPFTQVADDLVAIYYVKLGDCATATVTNNLLKAWGITQETLHGIALSNLADTCAFEDIMSVLGQSDSSDIPDDVSNDHMMYVLTNMSRTYGASLCMSDDVMDHVATILGTHDIFVVPSSIHELILLPAADLDPEMLKGMIADVNENQVDPLDRLSDNLYTYDYNEHKLRVVA